MKSWALSRNQLRTATPDWYTRIRDNGQRLSHSVGDGFPLIGYPVVPTVSVVERPADLRPSVLALTIVTWGWVNVGDRTRSETGRQSRAKS